MFDNKGISTAHAGLMLRTWRQSLLPELDAGEAEEGVSTQSMSTPWSSSKYFKVTPDFSLFTCSKAPGSSFTCAAPGSSFTLAAPGFSLSTRSGAPAPEATTSGGPSSSRTTFWMLANRCRTISLASALLGTPNSTSNASNGAVFTVRVERDLMRSSFPVLSAKCSLQCPCPHV